MNWIGGERNAGDARKIQSQDHYGLFDHTETVRGPKKRREKLTPFDPHAL